MEKNLKPVEVEKESLEFAAVVTTSKITEQLKEVVVDKTLDNTSAEQAQTRISDLKFFGDGNLFKLLCKASSAKEGWMKSTKAMYIQDIGCVVQVTTQQGVNIAESVVFVPGVKIYEDLDSNKEVIGRRLVQIF
jgi:hypothetical protein